MRIQAGLPKHSDPQGPADVDAIGELGQLLVREKLTQHRPTAVGRAACAQAAPADAALRPNIILATDANLLTPRRCRMCFEARQGRADDSPAVMSHASRATAMHGQ